MAVTMHATASSRKWGTPRTTDAYEPEKRGEHLEGVDPEVLQVAVEEHDGRHDARDRKQPEVGHAANDRRVEKEARHAQCREAHVPSEPVRREERLQSAIGNGRGLHHGEAVVEHRIAWLAAAGQALGSG